MGFHRYEDIRRLIRFDDKRTRAVRLETDHMAAFRYVWDCFLANCKKVFVPSDCVTIDEQLVPFRGRVHYAFNGMIYTGRQPGEDVQRNLGRNITMDNFFTSIPLAEKLLEKNLTACGDSSPEQARHTTCHEAKQTEREVQLQIWILWQHDNGGAMSRKRGRLLCC
ncbi:hypothetical protein JOQ06_013215 [Pogonophryne albipinna]|uniref:PiggyBac transposable element-derived protein domain-containing protein n=1 Tax=Pogonophryne albipinna TaxID=1090488 RepID=A0AAD6BKL7_9TELE|nr:hypothetical protein JOQ06_013215 [Pogonophryne albipinna]